ncbi:MAG TPA: hypothetical protein VFR48_01825 [Solirubrobacteraceae bacterium]|nr:hypothetical protein [Solirubrobacteraceae bacterium]
MAALWLLLAACGSDTPRRTAQKDGAQVRASLLAPIDYDSDDGTGPVSSDADDDDLRGPKDRDNDADGGSGYFDSDDVEISDFGRPASAAELRSIHALLERYYPAVAAGEGAVACGLTYRQLAGSVAETLGRPPGPAFARGRTCTTVMNELLAHYRRQLRLFAPRLSIVRARVDGRDARIVLRFGPSPLREMYLAREGEEWRIDEVLDHDLP